MKLQRELSILIPLVCFLFHMCKSLTIIPLQHHWPSVTQPLLVSSHIPSSLPLLFAQPNLALSTHCIRFTHNTPSVYLGGNPRNCGSMSGGFEPLQGNQSSQNCQVPTPPNCVQILKDLEGFPSALDLRFTGVQWSPGSPDSL